MKKTFVIALLLRLVLGFLAACCLAIYLVPEEAQYWIWSRHLDWAYYSKPAGVAYQIALSTALFGDTELGIRALSVIISALIGVAIYAACRGAAIKRELAAMAALLFCLSPIGMLGSFAATTDGGMLLFSILAFGVLLKSFPDEKSPRWLLFAVLVALSGWFKWSAYILWLPAFLGLILYPYWRTRTVWTALLLSLVGLIPSLIWNIQRDWPTFQHVFHQAVQVGQSRPNFAEFFLAQGALLFPIPFIFFLVALWRSFKRPKPQVLAFSAFAAALLLLPFLGLSFFQRIQANWALIFMPPAAIAAALVGSRRWLNGSLIISAALSVVMLFVPILAKHGRTLISYRSNLFKEAVGWGSLRKVLQKQPHQDFLASNSYQMASILSFYGPDQSRAYVLNIDHRRKNQFSYMPPLNVAEAGKSGLFVLLQDKPFDEATVVARTLSLLKPYFTNVRFASTHVIYQSNRKPVKWILLFNCQGVLENSPIDPDRY